MNVLGFLTMSSVMLYISSYINLIYRYNKKIKKIREAPKIPKKCKVEIKEPEVKKFEKKLIHLKSFNKSFFYSNVSSLKIERNGFLTRIYSGTYDIRSNTIHLIDNFEFPHELNHMSSTFYDGKSYYSGFSQKGIGDGLNEGYTELLAGRYFHKNDSYPVETKITSNLEKIIDKDKMEEFYYTANLYDLVKELEQYDSRENVLDFIHCVDVISFIVDNFILRKLYYHILIKCMKKVNLYLLKWNAIKQKKLLDDNIISNKQCYNDVVRYSKRLVQLSNLDSIKYKVLDKKLITKEIKKVLDY